MEIEFEDDRLAQIETHAAAETRLPVAVIQAARHRLAIIRAAPDLQTLESWKSLQLKHSEEADGLSMILAPNWIMAAVTNYNKKELVIRVTSVKELLRGVA